VRRILSVVRDRIPARSASNYGRDLFNGDLDVITSLDAEEGELIVAFDGRQVTYGFGALGEW
jgi:exodeoxyribonuclease V alpha subunit